MQVTNVADKVTHAVIGRGQVESFGMSEDAELYHILSSALYSRKKEAAAREVLCNAWDSHVESGITDTPVEVTITDQKVTIRDFGTGIPPEKIKPVYGTYGKSTKQHDGRQTGGFGLGSKAPFAYTDHFEVTSMHLETKTIYKMSQSNAEVGGKPSITTIVSLPTDETGLQVSFSLKDAEDRHEFEALITRLVEMGDMNVTLNGRKLETIPFGESPHGFTFVKKERFTRSSFSAAMSDMIWVRYGHVVYPLKSDDRFAHLFDETLKFLQTLTPDEETYYRTSPGDWVLVLEAEPHSISVVPSREDLSMTDKTVATVSEMLRKFMGHARGRLQNTMEEMFEDAIDKVGIAGTPQELFTKEKKVPLIHLVPQKNSNFIQEFDSLSRHYLKQSYPKFEEFRSKDLRMKVNALIQTGYGNRGLLQSFKAEMLNGKNAETAASWFHRRLVGLALRKADRKTGIDPDRLYVYTTVGKGRYGSTKEPGFVLAKEWRAPTTENCIPFLRGLVILTHARHGYAIDRLRDFPVCKHWIGNALDSLCYVVQKRPERVAQAREHFAKLGFHVLDLTIRHPWEATEPVLVGPRPKAKPKKKGLPRLDAALNSSRTEVNTHNLKLDDVTRIEKPEFVVKIPITKAPTNSIDRFGGASSAAICRLYGNLGAVAQNSNQVDKYIAEGAVELRPWLFNKLVEEFKTNPKIKEHYCFSVAHRETLQVSWEAQQFFKLVRKDDELRKRYGLPDKLDADSFDVITIWESFSPWEFRHHTELKEIKDLIDSWALDPAAEKVLKLVKDNKLLTMLDPSDIEQAFLNTNSYYTTNQQKSVRAILLLALEG